MKSLFLSFLIIFVTSFANAEISVRYSDLALRDLEDMSKMINDKISESRRTKTPKPLQEALVQIFSRPNDDALIEKILPAIKNELDEQSLWRSAMEILSSEALAGLQKDKDSEISILVTYWVIIENIISEFKPNASNEFEKKILNSIRAANLKISKPVADERRLRMMRDGVVDLSKAAAAAILFAHERDEKEKKARAALQKPVQEEGLKKENGNVKTPPSK